MTENTEQEPNTRFEKLKEQNQELAKEIAVLEEKMNTKHAETETSIERMNAAFERLRTDMAKRDVEAGKRENRLLLAILGGIAVATTILGVLITAIPTP